MVYVYIVLAGILIWAMVLRPRQRAKKAMPSIIQVFREHSAVGLHNAQTLDELGLEFKTPRMFHVPDYRLSALAFLIKATVIQRTEEGKYYLSEETPAKTEETEDKERGEIITEYRGKATRNNRPLD